MTEKLKEIDWQKVKVISFDLDDTLWDNQGVIEKCEQDLLNYLAKEHPPIGEQFDIEDMQAISNKLIQEDRSELDNMTVLRKEMIHQMLEQTGGDLALINPAFAVFYRCRSQIDIPKLTHDLLSTLKSKYSLFATSNGNSNLYALGLMDYFEQHFIAGIHGRAKPSPEMLHKICELKKIEPQELLHIGDSYETDIKSSIAAECQHLEIHVKDIGKLYEWVVG
ncbi:HAD family hydrolase [Kangiella profundi]|uniref:HAD family hydrolase n=1 Tax=Kangiella profundi TaxID=1561924 RepID=A0A2K9AFU8_9GAMM|nr:HAD-IA family hydrolase [Kangiella profundi]AUD77814.1 HAD family hydrolase [Kangiella profundi]GGE92290.1 flavin mononucleotide phosphatase [Kangiella profundi]